VVFGNELIVLKNAGRSRCCHARRALISCPTTKTTSEERVGRERWMRAGGVREEGREIRDHIHPCKKEVEKDATLRLFVS
jgi:hypothetical protein